MEPTGDAHLRPAVDDLVAVPSTSIHGVPLSPPEQGKCGRADPHSSGHIVRLGYTVGYTPAEGEEGEGGNCTQSANPDPAVAIFPSMQIMSSAGALCATRRSGIVTGV
jgi:hypothetical protein